MTLVLWRNTCSVLWFRRCSACFSMEHHLYLKGRLTDYAECPSVIASQINHPRTAPYPSCGRLAPSSLGLKSSCSSPGVSDIQGGGPADFSPRSPWKSLLPGSIRVLVKSRCVVAGLGPHLIVEQGFLIVTCHPLPWGPIHPRPWRITHVDCLTHTVSCPG